MAYPISACPEEIVVKLSSSRQMNDNVLYHSLSRLRDDRKKNADANRILRSRRCCLGNLRDVVERRLCRPSGGATVVDGSACGHQSKSRPAFSKTLADFRGVISRRPFLGRNARVLPDTLEAASADRIIRFFDWAKTTAYPCPCIASGVREGTQHNSPEIK